MLTTIRLCVAQAANPQNLHQTKHTPAHPRLDGDTKRVIFDGHLERFGEGNGLFAFIVHDVPAA